MADKTRIMVVGDKSVANTGFAIYNNALLSHLYHNTDYEIAEFAGVGMAGEKNMVPWKYYPTIPTKEDVDGEHADKYGRYRWARAAIHYKPNLVICLQDPWDYRFLNFCEFRDRYKLCLSVPVDGIQLDIENVNNCYMADAIVPYTKFGQSVLARRGVKTEEPIPMGIDSDIFKPLNKYEVRREFRLPSSGYIYGFVARNQPRKRLPELFRAFRKAIDESGRDDLYLYLHTTYPDIMCWDIPSLLLEFNLTNNVYFTYKCLETNKPYAGLYQEPFRLSPYNNKMSGRLCSQQFQVSQEDLNKIYNCLDLYIQCASNEGLGYPVLECAATNTPIVAINHSAMTEVTKNVGGELLEPDNIDRDYAMHMDRASTPIKSLVNSMLNFDREPQNNREKLLSAGYEWKTQLNRWTDLIEKMKIDNNSWGAEFPLANPSEGIEGNLSVRTFVEKCASGLSHPYGLNSLREIQELYYGGHPGVRDGQTSEQIGNNYNQKYMGRAKAKEMIEQGVPEEGWML